MSQIISDSEDSFIINSDGKKLFCKYWDLPDSQDEPRGLVLICHGFGEHCLWYDTLAKLLNKMSLFCFSHDHVGHGRSEGDRVHVDDFDTYVKDVFLHIESIRRKYPNIPLFLIGHSMGGTIAIKAAQEHPEIFRGTILIAPCIIASKLAANMWMRLAARVMCSINPQFSLGGIDPKLICRDPEVIKIYETDPLIWHGGLKAKWGICMINTLLEVQNMPDQVEWPFLILHGDADKLCEIIGSRQFFEKAKSQDKMFKEYAGYYHQLHNEPGKDGEIVRNDIGNWIVSHL